MPDIAVVAAPPAPPVQADSDETLIRLWLHGRSPHTVRAYEADAVAFLAHADVLLRAATVRHLQAWADSLVGSSTATQARRINAVKSLFAFGHRLGYLPFDVGSVVRPPAVKATLAERIMDEASVHRLLAREDNPRNHALLRLLYHAGLRISEACGLRWCDLTPRGDAGQITVFGKGGKTRVILLGAGQWQELVALRGDAGPDAPVFRPGPRGNRKERLTDTLAPSHVDRIVKAAVARAGLPPSVSAHWLRHAHASHALDRGAPSPLVQATLGHASLETTGRYAHARPNTSSALYLAL
jgi:integrase/recombinase XerD